jgi:hypothetical protein
LTPIPGTFDFGDTSFSKFLAGIIFLTISLISFIGVCIYIYKMACDRGWDAPKVSLKSSKKEKKMYEYEDDKRMKRKRNKPK